MSTAEEVSSEQALEALEMLTRTGRIGNFTVLRAYIEQQTERAEVVRVLLAPPCTAQIDAGITAWFTNDSKGKGLSFRQRMRAAIDAARQESSHE